MAIIKVVVLGDTECGKTSFTQRYVTGNFPDPAFLRTTIGASFDTKKVVLPSGRDLTLSIWDFGGQQRFIEQLKGMIRGARAGLLFFDVVPVEVDVLEALHVIEGPRIADVVVGQIEIPQLGQRCQRREIHNLIVGEIELLQTGQGSEGGQIDNVVVGQIE